MKTKKPIHIIIADDHVLLIEGLKLLLQDTHIKVIGEAYNGQEALELLKAKKEKIDIAVLDIKMPIKSGAEVVKSIKELGLPTKTLMLTSHNEGAFVKELINAGANGYILKNLDKEEFITALETIMNGGTYLKGEVLDNYITTSEIPEPKTVHLTRRELEVLQLLAQDNTSGEIALKLKIATSTVDTYRRNLIEKTGVKSSLGLVTYAHDKGLTKKNR